MQIIWIKETQDLIDDETRKKIIECIKNIKIEDLEKLGEYEETGESITCRNIDPYETGGLIIKIVRHDNKYMVTAGTYQKEYAEEYYIAIISI